MVHDNVLNVVSIHANMFVNHANVGMGGGGGPDFPSLTQDPLSIIDLPLALHSN